MSPLCQTHITAAQLNQMEPFYPLHAYVCEHCFLVQLAQFVAPQEIFSEYAYFSSFADSWVEHARHYCELASTSLGITRSSLVMEIASNDGYLLQHFVARGIPVLGIEPAANVAAAAIAKGVPTVSRFFGAAVAREVAAEFGQPDLLIGNNVLAHVPELNDFVAGLKLLLRAGGLITMEFPHLLELMQHNQFDTIYHEHFSYFSLRTASYILAKYGLNVFDVETLPTHGGSLRIYADRMVRPVETRVSELLVAESKALRLFDFQKTALDVKLGLLEYLIAQKRAGRRVAACGAAAKGASLLNYAGVKADLIEFVTDNIPAKQGLFMPGSRIPIHPPEKMSEEKIDVILILPWNVKDEIAAKLRSTGAELVVAIPKIEVL